MGSRVAGCALLLALVGCVTPSGQRVPGVGRNAEATTEVLLACENVGILPKEVRDSGLIFVDDAYYGTTSRSFVRVALGNSLIIGRVRVEKNRVHEFKVVFRGYEPMMAKKYFGNLQEYVVPFRLKILQPKSLIGQEG